MASAGECYEYSYTNFSGLIVFCPQIREELRDYLILKNKKLQFHFKIKLLKKEFDKTIIGFLK